MINSSANARAVDSSLTAEHRFPWKWYLSDLKNVQKNGLTVFSCFSCGGGSSMGYKMAGYDVIGNIEIDPRVMDVYVRNNHPKYPYLMDVRDFLKIPDAELPGELFHLDILDGSPPCSVFSTAGEREKGWNKKKVFREGQVKQKLDDLFFYFIQIAQKLKPRVVVAENVPGLIKGNARGYVNQIFKTFDAAGYKAQLFFLNAAFMGVPQKRERCIFAAHKKDMNVDKLQLQFNEQPILFGQIRTEHGKPFAKKGIYSELLKNRIPTDYSIGDITKRLRKKESGYNNTINHDDKVAYSVVASGCHFRMCDGLFLSDDDIKNAQTFPQDYDFGNQPVQYVCGMSVPPVMMAQISTEICNQWFRGKDV